MPNFAISLLNVLLRSQAFGAAGALVWCVADMIVAGNLVGVDALAGIAATVPVTIGAKFLAQLVYCGAGYMFAKYQGEFNRKKAREAVGLSLELAACVGLLTFLTLFFGRDVYLDLMGITGGVREQAVAYWRWMTVFCALNPLTMTMWRLVYADGEAVTTAVGDLLAPPLTVALSIVFTKATGTAAGAALGTLVAGVIADSTMCLHVFRKTNAVVPKWRFSLAGAWELVAYSLTDSSTKFCQCGFMIVVNKLVVLTASAAYLPVVSVIALVLELRALLDRIGDAYMPIAKMYLGEENLPRVRELVRRSLAVSVVAGLGTAILVIAFAPQIVRLYGIPHGDVFDRGLTALRICALALPISSVLSFLCSHYLVLERIRLSVVETVLEEFVLAAGCVAGFSLVWGFDAMWVGLPVGCALTLGVTCAYVRFFERRTSLMLIPPDVKDVLNLSYAPTPERAVAARNAAEAFLKDLHVDPMTVSRVMLLVEECSLAVVDANRETAKRLRQEVSFVVGDFETSVVFRDTGRVTDVTDADASPSSLRAFILSGLMESYKRRRYLNTIGCNRAEVVLHCGRRGCRF